MNTLLDGYLEDLDKDNNYKYIKIIIESESNKEEQEYIFNYCNISKNSESINLVGYLCYEIKNYEKAIDLFQKATHLGDSNAMYNLAIMYKGGQGIEKDDEKVMYFLKKSIALGNRYSMYSFALMYEKGKEKDYKKAIEFYKMCKGLKDAKEKIKNIYKNNFDYFYDEIEENEKLKEENESQRKYITHLETIPYGKKYHKLLYEFNKIQENLTKNDL